MRINTTFRTPGVQAGLKRMGVATVVASALSGSPAKADLIAYWDFNTPNAFGATIDVRAGHPGQFLGGAALTPDAQGHTGAAGDRAARFGTAAQRIQVVDATFLNPTAATDAMSISLWIKE